MWTWRKQTAGVQCKTRSKISRCSYSLLLSLSLTSQLVNLKTASVFNTCHSESRQNLRCEWFLLTPVPASHLSEVLGSCWRSHSPNPSWPTPDCVCLPSSSLPLPPLFSTLSPPTIEKFLKLTNEKHSLNKHINSYLVYDSFK